MLPGAASFKSPAVGAGLEGTRFPMATLLAASCISAVARVRRVPRRTQSLGFRSSLPQVVLSPGSSVALIVYAPAFVPVIDNFGRVRVRGSIVFEVT